MKIRKIKWQNHDILGNLELDFIKPSTGNPFDTILFAGENGTGKTTILETISTFLNRGSFRPFEFIEYEAEGKILTAVQLNPLSDIEDFFCIVDDQGSRTNISSNRNNNPDHILANRLDIRHYGCVFSKARADYKTSFISSTTGKKLDTDKYDLDNEDDFTSLKQLIVDINYQDNSDYAEINKTRGSNPESWEDFFLTSKTYRFKNAFDNFFQNLKFDKVLDVNSSMIINFIKNGKSISIDRLSTGEKQIVFRGIYLLKNSQQLDGSAIMIDEPELSMHPKWQQNILKYYKSLFTENNTQKAQLFIATHSEYVLEDALRDRNENLIIVLNEASGSIIPKRIDFPTILPTITAAETNYLAFDVVSNDYHIELYGYLQHKNNISTVKACDDFIKGSQYYNSSIHAKPSSFSPTTTRSIYYDTLCTYIRNAIDHPNPNSIYTEDELRTSIELLIELCR